MRSSTRRCSSPAGAGTSTGRSWSCASAVVATTRRRSSGWKPTTSWPRCSRRRRRARTTSGRPDRDPRPRARPPDDRRHPARGARPRRRARAAGAASSRAQVEVHCVDTTEPSVLAHEIVTSQPYTFLDDEEFQNRRTNAVHAAARPRRRPRPRSARSSPTRSTGCARRSRPSPRPPTTCTTSLSSLVLIRARDDWRSAVDRARRHGRRAESRTHGGHELWCITELGDDADRALDGDERRGRRGAAGAPRDRRGHHRRAASSVLTTLPPLRVAAGLAVLQNEGFALQGRYTPGDARRRSGCRAACSPACTRTRAGTGASRASAVTAQDFMRFLLRWQHVAPGTQLDGERRARARCSTSSRATRPRPWPGSPSCWPAACATTGPSWLDRLCHEGQVGWLRLTPRARDDADAPAGAPSKATPISVVFRDDSRGCSKAARGGAEPA